MLAFQRLARPATGISLRLMQQMYCAMALPKMTYVVDVWYTPTHRKEGAKKMSGSVGITRKLTSVQCMASLAIMGALHSTPTNLLDLHAGLWPVHILLQWVCHWAAMRIASLLDAHPLHNIYQTRARRYIEVHRAPLHELAAMYGIVPGRVEVLDPVCTLPPQEIKATITLAGSNDEHDEEAVVEDGEVQLFSDGSGLDGSIGAVAVMYNDGREVKVLRYCLGTLTDHTVFEAEATGVLLALHMLWTERNVKKATIWLDNQAVLGALTTRKPKPGQNIIDEVISQVEYVWQRATNPAFRLEIGWVKGHSGVEGNERVDMEAKEASRGRTSRAQHLPAFLINGALLRSLTAQRQAFNTSLQDRWRGE